MLARLCFVLCLGWAIAVLGLLALGSATYPHELTDGEVSFYVILAIAPALTIKGAVWLLKWIIHGSQKRGAAGPYRYYP